MNPQISKDPRLIAKMMYHQGYRVSEICRTLRDSKGDFLKNPTVHSWKKRDNWDGESSVFRVNTALEERLCLIISKENKTKSDINEIDLLTRSMEKMARITKYSQNGTEGDLNPKLRGRRKNKKVKNEISDESVDLLKSAFRDELFDYQKNWFNESSQKIRIILKSRQIGATYYFAREHFIDALLRGRNKIFISASKNQSHLFKQYIISFVRDVAGVDLTGDPIILQNGAHLYFLGNNYHTAQGYHGDLVFDEFMWTQSFNKINDVVSGVALHKQWTSTYISTPSSKTHDSYHFFTGDNFNKGRKDSEKIKIDISHKNLKGGLVCADRKYRQIVNIEDAIAQGCDLFDIEDLKFRFAKDVYQNLLMCEFLDDTSSVFNFSEMSRCLVDSWERWDDFKPLQSRTFGDNPVWIGYDPARTGDNATVVVVSPPGVKDGKFRVLEKFSWQGMDFMIQAKKIQELTKRYNVKYIGVDVTGIGWGVGDMVRRFYPAATMITYNLDVKNRLVLKAKNIIDRGRLEVDSGWGSEIISSFLMIKKELTDSQTKVTYKSDRNSEDGHADLAWAVMHALDNEPFGNQSNPIAKGFCKSM